MRLPAPVPTLASLALLLLAAACGGGGDGAVAAPPNGTDLGLVSLTVPTTVPVPFTNPLGEAATVTEIEGTGGFSIDPGDLPATLPPFASRALGVRVVPPRPGTTTGTVTLRFRTTQAEVHETHAFVATAESVLWALLTPSLDFGLVAIGAAQQRTARFRNQSLFSPVTLTGVNLPSADYDVVGTPFPIVLDPGDEGTLTLRFTPREGGDHGGQASIGPTDSGGPVLVPLLASAPGSGAEIVTDFGTRAFSGALTAALTVNLPADAVSLSIEAVGQTGGSYGLGELLGPGGRVYENQALTGDYIWLPGHEIFATTVPNTDRSSVQLVPGGGDYTFRIRRLGGNATSVAVRAIVERRDGGTNPSGVLDLNVWLADGLSVSATEAPSDGRLQSVLSRIDAILAGQSVRLGDIAYYDVANPAFDEVTSNAEFGELLRTTSDASATRLNLFFVDVALGGGVVGVSATIAGPALNGTSLSGVMAVYGGFSTNTVALIAAHELGHFLGLYHTVEEDGSHDFIDDTAECPASGTDTVCPTAGGGLLMHWRALGGTHLTGAQGSVLRGHPLLRPRTGSVTKFTPVTPPALSLWDLIEAGSLGDDWCGCPGCAHTADAKGAPR